VLPFLSLSPSFSLSIFIFLYLSIFLFVLELHNLELSSFLYLEKVSNNLNLNIISMIDLYLFALIYRLSILELNSLDCLIFHDHDRPIGISETRSSCLNHRLRHTAKNSMSKYHGFFARNIGRNCL